MNTDIRNNKRIAKNTLLLYIRMFLSIIIGLYTSRVILNALDIEDYGIYNVVGGVVYMFNFLNAAMIATSQRFIAYELGKGENANLRKVFSMIMNTHTIIALVVLVLAETIGLWFVNVKLNIPIERINAANWVYQCSILSMIISIIGVPYNASIVANEKMSVYAYVSIFEVLLKLSAALLLTISLPIDRLKLYAVLTLVSAFLIRLVYVSYCKNKIDGCKYVFIWDKGQFKEMMNFAGWSFFGNFGFIAKDQGVNILINIFEGPVVNAARGLAYQVNGVIQGFVQNFQMAMNPQITKLYASGNQRGMIQLAMRGSKYSFFLLLMIVVPILLNMDYILDLWLVEVPEFTNIFLSLALIMNLVHSMAGSFVTSIQATGKIKTFQLVIAAIMMLDVPISYVLLKMGNPAYCVMYVAIFTNIAGLMARVIILKSLIPEFPIKEFCFKVFLRNVCVFVLTYFVLSCFSIKVEYIDELLLYGLFILIYVLFVIMLVGLDSNERSFLYDKVRILIHR